VLENIRVAAQTYRLSFNFWGRAAALTAIRDKAGVILKEVGLWDKRELLAATSPTARSGTSSSASHFPPIPPSSSSTSPPRA
jgi:hypothetical protein